MNIDKMTKRQKDRVYITMFGKIIGLTVFNKIKLK